jgi:hypothetical protein
VAARAAEAGTEGGFLGFGGVAVSEAGKSTLTEIAAALVTSLLPEHESEVGPCELLGQPAQEDPAGDPD